MLFFGCFFFFPIWQADWLHCWVSGAIKSVCGFGLKTLKNGNSAPRQLISVLCFICNRIKMGGNGQNEHCSEQSCCPGARGHRRVKNTYFYHFSFFFFPFRGPWLKAPWVPLSSWLKSEWRCGFSSVCSYNLTFSAQFSPNFVFLHPTPYTDPKWVYCLNQWFSSLFLIYPVFFQYMFLWHNFMTYFVLWCP